MLFLMLKSGLEATGDGQRFAGGSHGFLCMARTLAAAGHEVRVFITASKAQLMHEAVIGGYFTALRYAAGGAVVCWEHGGLHWHASLTDRDQGSARRAEAATSAAAQTATLADGPCARLAPHEASLIAEASAVVRTASNSDASTRSPHSSSTWVVLDADGSQQASAAAPHTAAQARATELALQSQATSSATHTAADVALASCAAPEHSSNPPSSSQPSSSQSSSSQPSSTSTLMEGVARAFGRQVLVLVQNVHFLPYGPHGTAARTPGLLAAWAAIGGALAVSSFVAEYVQQHGALAAARVRRVSYNAWGGYGHPPFADLGDMVTAKMQQGHSHHDQQQHQQPHRHDHHQQEQQPEKGGLQQVQLSPATYSLPGQRPVVGMLKLTLEKGAAVFCQLARLLPQYDFVAVAGSPRQLELQLQQQLRLQVPLNVRFVLPHVDLEKALAGMWVVLAPSVWQEVFGMVVVDAMLRGIPVITSSSGGLPEAGLGVAQVLPLQPMQLPVDAATGTPCWQLRQYPAQQELGAWVDAIHAVVGSGQDVYVKHSQAARAAALDYVGAGGDAELAGFLAWLEAGGPGS